MTEINRSFYYNDTNLTNSNKTAQNIGSSYRDNQDYDMPHFKTTILNSIYDYRWHSSDHSRRGASA